MEKKAKLRGKKIQSDTKVEHSERTKKVKELSKLL